MKKKNINQKPVCCSLCGDSCKVESKKVKVYFCPKCKSRDVGFIFTLKNIFGILPKMKCKKCNFESFIFPQIFFDNKKLNKIKKKK